MKRGKKLWLTLKRILKSKSFVVIALLVVICSGMADAKAEYKAGVAYQYYLLGTRGDDMQEEAKNGKIMHMGSLGSGGVSGTFSYDDIVNSADVGATADDKKKNTDEAKEFASIMATYSTFHYFSNRVEGFSSILSYIGRALSAIILLPEALILDILGTVVPLFVSLIAKLNVIRYLASMTTNFGITSDLTNALGITKEQFEAGITAFFSFTVMMIVISFVMMFKSGGRVDQRNYSKFKGRLFSLIAVPLVIGIGAQFIQDLMSLVSTSTNNSSAFSRYLVDDRSWAYNFNFAPNGNNGADGNIQGSNSSYVDLKFNPYTSTGEQRIKQINENSSLTQKLGGKYDFSNCALALSFVMSDAFSAQDYINYKGTEASQSLYGQSDSTLGGTYGSYYQYAIDQQNQLGDVSKSYFPSGGVNENGVVDGPYQAAIDDYATDKKLTVNPSVAWRDRFIYGAKTGGGKIDKYYGAAPSLEQMENSVGVGSKGEKSFSDQSTFLILSTMFGETGGKYYLDAPARGVMQAKASFDSNRSTYYVVSMVGNPFFTMFGMVSKPIIQIIALIACIMAILTMGLLDMNLRPLAAWAKGSILGDIEYSYALMVYAVGIGGTIVTLTIIPDSFVKVVDYIPKIIGLSLDSTGVVMQTPQASLAFYGVGLIFEAVVGIIMAVLFWKSKKFRSTLIDLYTFCWSWARVTGERLERQASSAGQIIKRDQRAMNDKREQFWSKAQDRFGDKHPNRRPDEPDIPPTGPREGSNGFDYPEEEAPLEAREIAKNGVVERSMFALRDLEDSGDEEIQDNSALVQDNLRNLEKNPTKENFNDTLENLSDLQQKVDLSDDEDIDDESREQLNRAKEDLFNLAEQYGFKVDALRNSVEDPDVTEAPKSDFSTSKEPVKPQEEASSQRSNTFKEQEFTEKRESSVSSGERQDIPPQKQSVHHIIYETTEVNQLASAFGNISSDEQVGRALEKLDKANNYNEVQQGFAGLQDAVDNLELSEKKVIDVEKVSKAIDDIYKSTSKNN